MSSGKTQFRAVGDGLAEHSMADVCNLMVLISV
jgi:hypothetical protein